MCAAVLDLARLALASVGAVTGSCALVLRYVDHLHVRGRVKVDFGASHTGSGIALLVSAYNTGQAPMTVVDAGLDSYIQTSRGQAEVWRMPFRVGPAELVKGPELPIRIESGDSADWLVLLEFLNEHDELISFDLGGPRVPSEGNIRPYADLAIGEIVYSRHAVPVREWREEDAWVRKNTPGRAKRRRRQRLKDTVVALRIAHDDGPQPKQRYR